MKKTSFLLRSLSVGVALIFCVTTVLPLRPACAVEASGATLAAYQRGSMQADDMVKKARQFSPRTDDARVREKIRHSVQKIGMRRIIKRVVGWVSFIVLLSCMVMPGKVTAITGADPLVFAILFMFCVGMLMSWYLHKRTEPFRETITLQEFIDTAESGTVIEDSFLVVRLRWLHSVMLITKNMMPMTMVLGFVLIKIFDFTQTFSLAFIEVLILVSAVFSGVMGKMFADTVNLENIQMQDVLKAVAFSIDREGNITLWYDKRYGAIMHLIGWFLPPLYSHVHPLKGWKPSLSDALLERTVDVRVAAPAFTEEGVAGIGADQPFYGAA